MRNLVFDGNGPDTVIAHPVKLIKVLGSVARAKTALPFNVVKSVVARPLEYELVCYAVK